MQEDFTTLDTPSLLEKLASYTADYTKLMTEGTKEEFEICRLKISLIQQELHCRKQSQNNKTISDTNIELSSEPN